MPIIGIMAQYQMQGGNWSAPLQKELTSATDIANFQNALVKYLLEDVNFDPTEVWELRWAARGAIDVVYGSAGAPWSNPPATVTIQANQSATVSSLTTQNVTTTSMDIQGVVSDTEGNSITGIKIELRTAGAADWNTPINSVELLDTTATTGNIALFMGAEDWYPWTFGTALTAGNNYDYRVCAKDSGSNAYGAWTESLHSGGGGISVVAATVSNLYAQKVDSTSIRIQGDIPVEVTATSIDIEIRSAGAADWSALAASKSLTLQADIDAFNGTADYYTWTGLALTENANLDYRVRINGGTWVESLWSGNGGFRMVVDLLAGIGDFEAGSSGIGTGWTATPNGATFLRTTESPKYLTYAQRITSTESDVSASRRADAPITIANGEHYLIIAEVLTDGVATAYLALINNAQNTQYVGKTTTAADTPLYGKYAHANADTNMYARFANAIAVGSVGWTQFDGIRVYRIDQATYDKIDVDANFTGASNILKKFPYVY